MEEEIGCCRLTVVLLCRLAFLPMAAFYPSVCKCLQARENTAEDCNPWPTKIESAVPSLIAGDPPGGNKASSDHYADGRQYHGAWRCRQGRSDRSTSRWSLLVQSSPSPPLSHPFRPLSGDLTAAHQCISSNTFRCSTDAFVSLLQNAFQLGFLTWSWVRNRGKNCLMLRLNILFWCAWDWSFAVWVWVSFVLPSEHWGHHHTDLTGVCLLLRLLLSLNLI